MRRINFDNGSTSFPKAPNVGRAMCSFIDSGAYNINRGGYEAAYDTADMVMEVRERIAALFNVTSPRNVIFTPGVTYSLNYFIKGFLREGCHVVVSGMEHNAVMRPLRQMEKLGVKLSIVACGNDGSVTAEAFEECFTPETAAVIATHASNVCGTVLPVREIGAICRRRGILFAVDAAQTAGVLPLDMENDNIDFLAFTGHKGLLGPQGIGGFVIRRGLGARLEPVICGGTGSMSDIEEPVAYLPDRFENGTMNLPGIAGLGAALEYVSDNIGDIRRHELELTDYFLRRLCGLEGVGFDVRDDVRIVGLRPGSTQRVGIVSVDFKGHENDRIAFLLDSEAGIMTRVGLHCAPRAHMTLGTYPGGTVRFAFGYKNTQEEIDCCIESIKAML